MFAFSENPKIDKVLHEILNKSVDFEVLNSICKFYGLEYDIDFIGNIDKADFDDLICFNFVFTKDNGESNYPEEAAEALYATKFFDDMYDDSYDDYYQLQANIILDPDEINEYLD